LELDLIVNVRRRRLNEDRDSLLPGESAPTPLYDGGVDWTLPSHVVDPSLEPSPESDHAQLDPSSVWLLPYGWKRCRNDSIEPDREGTLSGFDLCAPTRETVY
jgi:hypothetical protein